MDDKPLRVFVAMPGTTMGDHAPWSDIEEIKRRFLTPVAKRIKSALGRPVQLVVEKDKLGSAAIHPSMFGEAVDSDVYIADLSGANANVYLELGVRWALRDGITILISQDVGRGVPLPFNVSANRVIPYGPMPDELDHAIGKIADSVQEATADLDWIDSPVRSSHPQISIARSDFAELKAQLRQLREEHADELVAAARKAAPAQAVTLLRTAIERYPMNIRAHYDLGILLREIADYDGAVGELQAVADLDTEWAPGWRELGITFSKNGQLAEAADAIQHAVGLDSADPDIWTTLGGLQRRLARMTQDGSFDWAILRQARDAYQHACQLRPNDSYASVNVGRIDLLLSETEPATQPGALGSLRRLQNLARYEASPLDPASPRDYWKVFDLADTLLLTGSVNEGLTELRAAINLIEPGSRAHVITSVLPPLRDFLTVSVLDHATIAGIRDAISICEEAMARHDLEHPGPAGNDN